MLPELIEIVPLDKPVRAEITVPGSKSITNRALVLAALADGETTLQGALWSEDTQVMADCLEKLGFTVTMKPDPDEFCNRTITVKGLGGRIPNGGTADKPLELFVGNAGTAARFLAAMVCLGNGVYRLHGVPRMHERPQAALFQALRELGYRVDSENGNDKLPARIFGDAPLSGRSRGNETHSKTENQSLPTSAPTNANERTCTVSIEESSQFASALLLCAKIGDWKVNIIGENAEESPYVAMTTKMIEMFPKNGGTFQIEPDASSGSYFLALDWILWITGLNPGIGEITVKNWPATIWQIDAEYPKYQNLLELKGYISRKTHLGDSIMTAIVKAPFNRKPQTKQLLYLDPENVGIDGPTEPIKFVDLGRLRLQETERVLALRRELTKCGAKVVEEGDTLAVYPSKLHGAEIETYNDHRMAMCFAILGLRVKSPPIRLRNPSCVRKSFPNFFQKIVAAPSAGGIGAQVLNAKSGNLLRGDELIPS